MTEYRNKETGGELLTPEKIEDFIKALQRKGRSEETQETYRRVLESLYVFLQGRRLSPSVWEEWKQDMQGQGLQPKTINQRLSVYNSYLRCIGHKDWCGGEFLPAPEKPQPELTRNEYRRLLSAARQLEKEKAYLLIKLMGGFGITLQELPQLTVKTVETGEISRARQRPVRLPKALQEELAAYARQKGVKDGPVFQTAAGNPIDRTSIYHLVRSVSAAAIVEPAKASPRCLQNMYQRTKREIAEHMAVLAEQSYQRMLEEEQRIYGWEEEQSDPRERGRDGRAS